MLRLSLERFSFFVFFRKISVSVSSCVSTVNRQSKLKITYEQAHPPRDRR